MVGEHIDDIHQFQRFRNIAFYGTCILIAASFAGLVLWIWRMGGRVAAPETVSSYQAALFVTPLIALASVAALLVLALLRLAFRPAGSDSCKDLPDGLSVAHGLCREALAIFKDYLNRKPPAP